LIIDPRETEPVNVYKLLIGVVVPRPIAFVSSISPEGIYNLAPFSFFTVASVAPPVVCFCPVRDGTGRGKDSLHNASEVGEFVVNIVSEDIATRMNTTSAEYPPEVDEFAMSGLTPVASELVKAPRVAESFVSMECRLRQVVEVGPGPLGGSLVLGEVLRFHVADQLIDNYRIDPDRLRAIGRMAGNTYARTTDRFDMERPVLK
jgi:flavin reductase (DIM6/NTAB) family NADH-FMN oxidoreductase RutF